MSLPDLVVQAEESTPALAGFPLDSPKDVRHGDVERSHTAGVGSAHAGRVARLPVRAGLARRPVGIWNLSLTARLAFLVAAADLVGPALVVPLALRLVVEVLASRAGRRDNNNAWRQERITPPKFSSTSRVETPPTSNSATQPGSCWPDKR